MSDRKFGLEVEFVGVTPQRAADIVTASGTPCRFEGYNHIDHARWKIVTDGSVVGVGGELVAPPLSGEAGLREVADVLKAMNDAGVGVNRSCGLHVHADVSDLTAADMANVVVRYARFEVEIDRFMAPSRRGDSAHYARSLIGKTPTGSTKEAVARSIRADVYGTDRYFKINLRSYLRHGTIEFRQHGGTTNATKISNWIRFVTQFVDASKTAAPAGGTIRQHLSVVLSRSENRIIAALQAAGMGGVDGHALATGAGLGFESMRSAISHLRRKGFGIKLQRHNGHYRLVSEPSVDMPAAAPVGVDEPDNMWRGIDEDVRTYLETRAIALANGV